MNCQLFEQHYLDELDGLLDPPLASALHAHIDGCASCRHRLEDARDSLQMVRTWMAIREPSLALDQRIMTAAEGALVKRSASKELDQAPPRGLWAWLQTLLASPSFRPALAFCAVAMLVGSVYVYQAKYQEGLFQPKTNRGINTLKQMAPSSAASDQPRQEKSDYRRSSRAGTANDHPKDAVGAKQAASKGRRQGTKKSLDMQRAPLERPTQTAPAIGTTTATPRAAPQVEPPRRMAPYRMAPRRRAARRRSRRRYRRKPRRLAKRPRQRTSALRPRRTRRTRKLRSRKYFKSIPGKRVAETSPSPDTKRSDGVGLNALGGQEQGGQKTDDLSVQKKRKKSARKAKKARNKTTSKLPSVPLSPPTPAPRATLQPSIAPRKEVHGGRGGDSPMRFAPPPPPAPVRRMAEPIVRGLAEPSQPPSAGDPAPKPTSPQGSEPDKYNRAAGSRAPNDTKMNAPKAAQSASPFRGARGGGHFGKGAAENADKRRHEGLSSIARQAARRGQTRRAIALYQQATAHGTQAQRAEAHFQIATQSLKRNDLRTAKRHFALAISYTQVRDRPSMYDRITNAYRFRGKYQNAAEMLRRLIKLYPNRARQYQRALRKLPNTNQ